MFLEIRVWCLVPGWELQQVPRLFHDVADFSLAGTTDGTAQNCHIFLGPLLQWSLLWSRHQPQKTDKNYSPLA